MKKALLALFLAPTFIYAQNFKDNQVRSYLNNIQFFGTERVNTDIHGFGYELSGKTLSEQGVKSITVQRGTNKKKLTNVRYLLNNDGMIEQVIHPKDTIFYTYVQDSLVESIRQTGKTNKLSLYEYAEGKLKKKEVFEKNRLTSRTFLDYSEDDKVAFSLFQTGRKLRNSYVMNYDYNDGKIRQQEFVRNDRVIKTWDYSCDKKGEAVSEKTTSTICKFVEENSDGSYVNHVRKLENGEVLLYSYFFDKDSVNYAATCNKESGEKVWSGTYSASETTYLNYDSNGNLKQTTVSTFNSDKKILARKSTYGKKQNRTSSMSYEYNTDGLISAQISSYKGKISYVRNYNYEM